MFKSGTRWRLRSARVGLALAVLTLALFTGVRDANALWSQLGDGGPVNQGSGKILPGSHLHPFVRIYISDTDLDDFNGGPDGPVLIYGITFRVSGVPQNYIGGLAVALGGEDGYANPRDPILGYATVSNQVGVVSPFTGRTTYPTVFDVTVLFRDFEGNLQPLRVERLDPQPDTIPQTVRLYGLIRTSRNARPDDPLFLGLSNKFRAFLPGVGAIIARTEDPGLRTNDPQAVFTSNAYLNLGPFGDTPFGQFQDQFLYFSSFRQAYNPPPGTSFQAFTDRYGGVAATEFEIVGSIADAIGPADPPNLRYSSNIHVDAAMRLGPYSVPEIFPNDSGYRHMATISLDGGYATPIDDPGNDFFPGMGRIWGLNVTVTSPGRLEEILGDGFDNDFDRYYIANNNLDDDLDGVIDNATEGIDEHDLTNHQFANWNDDGDSYVDQPADPFGSFFDTGAGNFEYPIWDALNGRFETVDRIIHDWGHSPGILDASDVVGGNKNLQVFYDPTFPQVVGRNDDKDWFSNDPAGGNIGANLFGNPGIGLIAGVAQRPGAPFDLLFADNETHFNFDGVDEIFLDDGEHVGMWDPLDTVLSEGITRSFTVMGEPSVDAANNDYDHFFIAAGDRILAVTDNVLPPDADPSVFIPGIDEVWLDTGQFPLVLDAGDTALYLGYDGRPDPVFAGYNEDQDFVAIDPEAFPGVWQILNGEIVQKVAGPIDDATDDEEGEEPDIPELQDLRPLIDEELPNGLDDDGDGEIDEDLRNLFNPYMGFPLPALIDEDDLDGPVGDGNRTDDDRDGLVDEDGWGASPDRWFVQLIDEDPQDGIDNDGDGYTDEDIDYVRAHPLIDEEYLDYFIDKPGGRAGLFDPNIDEYYIDLNADGRFNDGYNDGIQNNISELISAGLGGTGSLLEGQSYQTFPGQNPRVWPLDNDGDGELNDDGLPIPDGKDNDPVYDRFSLAPFDGIDNDYDGLTDEEDEGLLILNNNFDDDFDGLTDEDDERYLEIDEGYNEDVGDIAFDPLGLFGVGTSSRDGLMLSLWREAGGLGFNPVSDELVGVAIANPSLSPIAGPKYIFDLFSTTEAARVIPGATTTFHIAMDTSRFFGGSLFQFGDDFSIQMGEGGMVMSPAFFAVSANSYVDFGVSEQSTGYPKLNMTGQSHTVGLFMQDIIGYNSLLEESRLDTIYHVEGAVNVRPVPTGRGFSRLEGPGTTLYDSGLPFVDANSSPLGVLGLNVADSAASPFDSAHIYDNTLQTIESLRVNFVNVDLEGIGVWDPTKLAPLADDESSGVLMYMDDSTPPGNNADDDGDGLVDEELWDHADNDGDGLTDEDLGDGDAISLNGAFDPLDDLVPINFNAGAGNNTWNPDPMDPLVQDRDGDGRPDGYYVIIKPNSGLAMPPDDDFEWQSFGENPDFLDFLVGDDPMRLVGDGENDDLDFLSICSGVGCSDALHFEMIDEWVNAGHDYFVAVRTSDSLNYNEAFRAFVRDGDFRTRNSRNSVGSGVKIDPVVGNVPVKLSDQTRNLIPPGDDAVPITANSPSTAVIGVDLWDSNLTFETPNGASPSRMMSMTVDFLNVARTQVVRASEVIDGVSQTVVRTIAIRDFDFTQTDLAPLLPLERQWVNIIDPGEGLTVPYVPGMPGQRIGSINAVTVYRDEDNSDTNGGFDDPFDPSVVNPDTPVLLSGDEEWNVTWTEFLTLFLRFDPPRLGPGGEDISTPFNFDPRDPDKYELLPDSPVGEITVDTPEGTKFGPDYFVVIRTSDTLTYGDDFRVRVASTGDGYLHHPIQFYPPLTYSYRHPRPQTPNVPVVRESYAWQNGLTNILRAPKITFTSLRDLIAKPNGPSTYQDATSPPVPVIAINAVDSEGMNEFLTGFRLDVESVRGLDRHDFRPLTGRTETEPPGIQLYIDGFILNASGVFVPVAGANGVFDEATDYPLPVRAAQWYPNHFADHPGEDGILGTADDPGTIGVYDRGIDEVYIDFDPLGILDPGDELVDDGLNDKRDTYSTALLPGATVPLHPLPGRLSAKVFLETPVGVPDTDAAGSLFEGPDYFVTVRTSDTISFLDQYIFHMAKDSVIFSSGKSLGSADIETLPMIANVPTYLEDPTSLSFPGFREIYRGPINDNVRMYPIVALNFVNDGPRDAFLSAVQVHFQSIDDPDFDISDLAPISPISPKATGIALWRDNGDGVFDEKTDHFIPLAGGEGTGWRKIDLPGTPWPRFGLRLALNANDVYTPIPGQPAVSSTLLPKTGPLESAGRKADYFLAIRASNSAGVGDDFFVTVPPGGVEFRGGVPSGEQVVGIRGVMDVNQVPSLVISLPEQGETIQSVHQNLFSVLFEAFDPDSDASVDLWYYPALTPSATAPLIGIDGTESVRISEDSGSRSFNWAVNELDEGLYGIAGRIRDDVFAVRAQGGFVQVSNYNPHMEILTPATTVETFDDTFLIEWTDLDIDNNASISLYLSEVPVPATGPVPPPASAVPAGAILVATGIAEDPDGEGDTFLLDIAALVASGSMQTEVRYYVLGVIDDGIGGNTGMISTSPGTLLRRDYPTVRVLNPSFNTSVNAEYTITFRTTSADPLTSTVGLFLSPTNVINGKAYTNLESIAPATPPADVTALIELPLHNYLPVPNQPNVYQYTVRTTTTDAFGNEILDPVFFNLIAPNRDFYIYAEVADASGDRSANFSNGQLRFNPHFVRVVRPPVEGEQAPLDLGEYPMEWVGQSFDPAARVSLFYDTNRAGLDGQILNNPDGAPALSEPLNGQNTFPWGFQGVQLGSYYLYAVVNDKYDDFGQPFTSYSEGQVKVGELGQGVMALRKTSPLYTTGDFQIASKPVWPGGDMVAVKLSPRGEAGYYALNRDYTIQSLDGALPLQYVENGALLPAPSQLPLVEPVDFEVFRQNGQTTALVLSRDGLILVAGTTTSATFPAGTTGNLLLPQNNARDLEVFTGGGGFALMTDDAEILVQGMVPAGLATFVTGGDRLRSPVTATVGSFTAMDLEVSSRNDGYGVLLADGRFYPMGQVPAFRTPFFGFSNVVDMAFFERLSEDGRLEVKGLCVLDQHGVLFSFGDAPLGPLRNASGDSLFLTSNDMVDLEMMEVDTFITTSELVFHDQPLTSNKDADPAISGSLVAFVDGAGSQANLKLALLDISDAAVAVLDEATVSAARSYQNQPALDGLRGVYTSRESLVADDIILFEVETSASAIIQIATQNLTAHLTSNQNQADISGDIVVWSGYDDIGGDFDIYVLDLADPSRTIVNLTPNDGGANQRNPKVYQDPATGDYTVVWEDNRNNDLDVFVYRSATGVTMPVATGAGNQSQPDVYENWVVYVNSANPGQPGDRDIYLVDLFLLSSANQGTLQAGAQRILSDDPFTQEKPAMTRDRTVWVDRSLRNLFDIFAMDANVGVVQMTNGFLRIESVDVDGDNLVWVEERDGRYQFWGGRVTLALKKPGGL